jgi:hypothetical protein
MTTVFFRSAVMIHTSIPCSILQVPTYHSSTATVPLKKTTPAAKVALKTIQLKTAGNNFHRFYMDFTRQVRRSIPLPSMWHLFFLNSAFDKCYTKDIRGPDCDQKRLSGYDFLLIAAYFRFEVTVSKSSQKVHKKDLTLSHYIMIADWGREDRFLWTPWMQRPLPIISSHYPLNNQYKNQIFRN